jgi:hypothetical protein
MTDGGYTVDTGWLRLCANDCDSTASAVQSQLAPADQAVNQMRNAAAGWSFPGSLDGMRERWENLNTVLHNELGRAAEEFRYSASDYDGQENWVEREFHEFGQGWDEVLNYD